MLTVGQDLVATSGAVKVLVEFNAGDGTGESDAGD
jgi:hypothetical protein